MSVEIKSIFGLLMAREWIDPLFVENWKRLKSDYEKLSDDWKKLGNLYPDNETYSKLMAQVDHQKDEEADDGSDADSDHGSKRG